MAASITTTLFSLLCLASFSTTAFAGPNNGYSGSSNGPQPSNNGYQSGSPNSPQASLPPAPEPYNPPSAPYNPPSAPYNPQSAPPQHHKKNKHVYYPTFVNSPNANIPYYVTRTYPRGKHLLWIDMWRNSSLPRDVVVGGNQPNSPYTLYVCRGNYRGGVHPGKLVGKTCNITWGGEEIRLSNYQVLVSKIGLGWISSNYGDVPVNAIEGGYEDGHPLYICQADYKGGMHPGKIVSNMCNIGWGGREISVPYYNVLIR